MPRLRPNGQPLVLGNGITLSTPGLDGDADVYRGVSGARSSAFTNPAFETELAAQAFETVHTIEIKNARELPEAPPTATRTVHGEDAIVLTVPAVNENFVQIVLMQDEAGVLTWTLAPVEGRAPVDAVRGTAPQTFVLRRYVPLQQPAGAERGMIGAIGTKVIKVLAFPIQQIGGAIATAFARSWEQQHRPYGLRVVTAANFADPGGGAVPDARTWSSFGENPVLLLVHGTFSTSPATYGLIPKQVFTQLAAAYGGRVLAFDHPTMTETPRENAEWLLAQIPADGTFVFDVLTHSRGGLVARTLAEKADALSLRRNVTIRNLVLTAVPDNGTALSDAQHMGDFIDTYMNLLNFFPDAVPLDVLHCVLAAVKELAAGALENLTGLASMVPSKPNGAFQQWLNTGPKGRSRYFAIGSAYSPSEPGLAEWAKQRLMGAIFKEDNDLVVPTAGVYDTNGSDCFPVATADRLLFGDKEGVWHCNYFTQPKVHAKLTAWLPTP